MDTEHSNSKNEAIQNQEEALEHLIEAVGKIDDSKQTIEKEHTQEVRLEVEGAGSGKTESIEKVEKLEQRVEHQEQLLKQMSQVLNNLNQSQKDLASLFDNSFTELCNSIDNALEEVRELDSESEENEEEKEQESSSPDTLLCGICGQDIGVKGFTQHITYTHDLDMKELFDQGDHYDAEELPDGFAAEDFKTFTQRINKRDDVLNITQLAAKKIRDGDFNQDAEEEKDVDEPIVCDICGAKYQDGRGLGGHLRRTHGISGEGVTKVHGRRPKSREKDGNDREPGEHEYRCPYCGDIMRSNAIAKHINASHDDEISLRDFFYDEQKETFIDRHNEIEHEDFSKFANRFSNLDVSPTEIYINAISEGYNSEQELAEKEHGIGSQEQEQEEETEQEETNVSDYERAKRNASVSDRDMEIAEKAFHKIIFDHLDRIPDSNEKFISYTGNENIPGFETLYSGDLSPLNMWRKIFSNTGLLTGINERVAENFDLTWERKGTSGSPKNWVIKVERTDK